MPFPALWNSLSYSAFPLNSKDQHELISSGWVKRGETETCLLIGSTGRQTWRESGMRCLHHDPNLCPLCTLPYNTCKACSIGVCVGVCVVGVGMVNTAMCFLYVAADNQCAPLNLKSGLFNWFVCYLRSILRRRAELNCKYIDRCHGKQYRHDDRCIPEKVWCMHLSFKNKSLNCKG